MCLKMQADMCSWSFQRRLGLRCGRRLPSVLDVGRVLIALKQLVLFVAGLHYRKRRPGLLPRSMQVLALLRDLRMAMRELAVMLLTWWMESMAALRRVLIGRLLRARLEVRLPWEHQVTQVMLPREVHSGVEMASGMVFRRAVML